MEICPWEQVAGKVQEAQNVIRSNHVDETKRELERKVQSHERNSPCLNDGIGIDTINMHFTGSRSNEEQRLVSTETARRNFLQSMTLQDTGAENGRRQSLFGDICWENVRNQLDLQSFTIRPNGPDKVLGDREQDVTSELSDITLIDLLEQAEENESNADAQEAAELDALEEDSEVEDQVTDDPMQPSDSYSEIPLLTGSEEAESYDIQEVQDGGEATADSIAEQEQQPRDNQLLKPDGEVETTKDTNREDMPEQTQHSQKEQPLIQEPTGEDLLNENDMSILSVMKQVCNGSDFLRKIGHLLASQHRASDNDQANEAIDKENHTLIPEAKRILQSLSLKIKDALKQNHCENEDHDAVLPREQVKQVYSNLS